MRTGSGWCSKHMGWGEHRAVGDAKKKVGGW